MTYRLSRSGALPIARRISRAPSPLLAYAAPWLTIGLASILPGWPLIAMAPVMPPLGFMTLLAWRQLRPGLLPVWAGFPLGLVDDLFSGQPVGSGMLLWSLTMITLEIIEARFPWRNFLTDWLVASIFILIYIGLGALVAGLHDGWAILVPQIGLSVLCYPLVGRSVGWIDRWRLTRFRVVG